MEKPRDPGDGEGDSTRRDPGRPGPGPGGSGPGGTGPGGSGPGRSGPGRSGPGPGRDPRHAWFSHGGRAEGMPPSAALAGVVEDLAGPDRRFPYATQDELEGLLDSQRKL